MKKILGFLIAAAGMLEPVAAQAATGHGVVLAWGNPQGNTTTTYNVYRLSGACPAVAPTTLPLPAGWSKLNTAPIAPTTYFDPQVTLGTFCYVATAVYAAGGNFAGGESGPSNDVAATLPAALPTGPAPQALSATPQ